MMDEVRQAHLPGNYELLDQTSNEIGPPICKLCWEEAELRNPTSLDTVWLSVDGRNVVWWLCRSHHEELDSGGVASTRVLKSESGAVRSPGIW